MDESSRVYLITGASSGIGRATALGLARQGGHVIMVCRHPRRGEVARSQITQASGSAAVDLRVADLASQQAIRALAADIRSRYGQLHVLVNNAGVMLSRRTLTGDGIERTFAVNHLAYFMLANLLLPLLAESAPARIVNVASGAAFSGFIAFDDLMGEQGYSRRRAYNQSKLANILFTYELARRTQGSGVTVNCLNPGNVITGLGGVGRRVWLRAKRVLSPAAYAALHVQRVEDAAQAVIHLASSPAVEGISGVYFVNGQPQESPAESYDDTVAQRLWAISADLTGLSER